MKINENIIIPIFTILLINLINLAPIYGQEQIYYGKIVYDPIGVAKLSEGISQTTKLVESANEGVEKLDALNNEVNGLRGQFSNTYNQSFGFIGESIELKNSVQSLLNDATRKYEDIEDNIKCLSSSDLSTLQKHETLLKARTIDYTTSNTQQELASKGSTTFFEDYLGASVRIPSNTKNLSECGYIRTDEEDKLEFKKAKIKFDEVNKMYEDVYFDQVMKDVQEAEGVPEDERYKTSKELLNDLTKKIADKSKNKKEVSVAEALSDQTEYLAIMAKEVTDLTTYSRYSLILKLDERKDEVYSEYAKRLYEQHEQKVNNK